MMKVVRILKKESQSDARCWEHLNFCTFLELLRKAKQNLRIAEKIQAATGKNNEKVEANFTGFSAEFFGS